MKPRIAAALFALLLALAASAPAHEKHAKKAAGAEQTLVAEVIDTSCYLQHGNSTAKLTASALSIAPTRACRWRC